MIVGIVGLIAMIPSCFCCPFLGIPLPIISIGLGVFALKTEGKGMGIAGIVMGAISLVIVLIGLIITIASVGLNGAANGGGFNNNNQGRFK